MHLHTHLLDCVLDYGPVYAFWLFSFERYNGILGDYGTNQRAVEIQLMRKFQSNQVIKDIPLPSLFRETFEPLLMKLSANESGTLQELFPDHCLPSKVIQTSLLSIGPVRKGDHWGHADLHYICSGPYSRHSLDVASLTNLKNCYAAIFDGLDEISVTPHFDRYACFRFHGDLLGSMLFTWGLN